MDEVESLSHTKWECKYHVVFIPKCRRQRLYQELRRHLGKVLRGLAEQKESEIEEGHLRPDHVHMMIAIPRVAQTLVCMSAPQLEGRSMGTIGRYAADAFLGTDAVWGGDVMCPSGTGRFIADSWFSGEPLPAAYHVPAAARVRAVGFPASRWIGRRKKKQPDLRLTRRSLHHRASVH